MSRAITTDDDVRDSDVPSDDVTGPDLASSPPSPDAELARYQILSAYKKRLIEDRNRTPFSADQVVRYDSQIRRYDVEQIHAEVRQLITARIEAIRDGGGSRVVILAGDPGMGKSHIINAFRNTGSADQLGYVLVGNSNHWKVEEFEAAILHWLLAALNRPIAAAKSRSATAKRLDSLLTSRIEQLAFYALDQIVSDPDQLGPFLGQTRNGPLGWITAPFVDDRGRIQQMARNRDVEVFRRLKFPAFANAFCERFLAEPSNPFHRYVAKVLLRTLFPEDRDLVDQWLLGHTVGDAFLKRLGARDAIDQTFKQIDVLKILISLFAPEVESRPSDRPDGPDARERDDLSRVVLFAFDQIEGRDELFESDDDWLRFFAQLSELYNTLPNVFVLFTMTISERDRLYPKMERQFRDRISRDPRFVLRSLQLQEALALYERRINLWLGNDPDGLRDRLHETDNPYLPLDRDAIAGALNETTLRSLLRHYETRFREALGELVIGPHHDYMFIRNEVDREVDDESEFTYFKDHTKHVLDLIDRYPLLIKEEWDLELTESSLIENEVTLQVVAFKATSPELPGKPWVRVHLARLGYKFKEPIQEAFAILKGKTKKRNPMWIVRGGGIDVDNPKPDQIQYRPDVPKQTESIVRALIQLDSRTASYAEKGQLDERRRVVISEIRRTYLGDLFDATQQQLRDLAGEPDPIDQADAEEDRA